MGYEAAADRRTVEASNVYQRLVIDERSQALNELDQSRFFSWRECRDPNDWFSDIHARILLQCVVVMRSA